jgi:hypothetical protein
MGSLGGDSLPPPPPPHILSTPTWAVRMDVERSLHSTTRDNEGIDLGNELFASP